MTDTEVPDEVLQAIGENKDHISTIIIGKNDSLQGRVGELLKLLQEAENRPLCVLLQATAGAIPRLVSLVEITCKKAGTKIYQYNHMSAEKSLENPNYRKPKPLNDEQAALQEVRGPKVFQLPVLRVLLSDEHVELSLWSEQEKK